MAMILDAVVGKLVDSLASLVEEKVVTVLGAKDELKRLQRRLGRIKHVLQDAEKKRIQSDAVAQWVRELKDVMYDADDIIDLCRFEGGKLLDDQPSTSSAPRSVSCNFLSCLSCFSSARFRHEIGERIKNLNNRLEEISRDMSDLNLARNEPDVPVTRVNPRQTSSLAPDIVGTDIEDATKRLVELIVREDEKKCRVFAVTGMGGIGKTTLAQNIFNHGSIQSEFSTKIWVCISQNYSETELIKEIIRGAGGKHGDLQTKAELLPLLKSSVSGKRYFLVLDDVWRADVWVDLLQNPVQSGAFSSRVLVTTRDRNVAKRLGAADIHRVEQLPVESGWELLLKSALVTGEEETQNLRDVGIQIVEKCDRLPLAIKTIAGVLTTKEKSRGEWEKVLRRDEWSMDKLPDDLRGALYLSYEDLPSHLKQCFLSCSLFPEDYQFPRQYIVKYWVAEGFVETQMGSFLESADECIEELSRRNLIQKAYIDDDDMFYKMHDLLRSLAQFLSQDETFCGEAHQLTTVSTSTKLRRLSIVDGKKISVIPETLLQHESLRTLMFLRGSPTLGDDIFMRFPFLRSLTLHSSGISLTLHSSGIWNVPDALGNLIHLRFLDLHGTEISNLPESIENLTNLQVLNLSGCESLHTLPKGITRLCNLRFIDFQYTPLRFMPAGMGRLEQVNIFKGFVVGEDSIGYGEQHEQGCSLEELRSLLQLRELSIVKVERAVVAHKGQSVRMNLRHLKHLELRCSTSTDGHTEEGVQKIEEVFAELAPPSCLERLEISGYFGREFPYWMMSSSLGTSLRQLRSLILSNCTTVVELPPLGLLPELRHLEIGGAPRVVTMGPEFFGSGVTSVSFPKLEDITVDEMPSLQEWSFSGEEKGLTVLPHLQKLTLEECPKLESLPRVLKDSNSLKKLLIADANVRRIDNLPYLTDRLDISFCNSLERISDLPALRELEIGYCPLLKCIEKVDALERLILDDAFMECFPEWLLRLLQQRQQQQNQDDNFQLVLSDCHANLVKRCLKGCEYWPIIQNIPRVKASTYGEDGYLVYTKKPLYYQTNLL